MTPAWTWVIFATSLAWGGALVAVALRQNAGRYLRPLIYLSLLFFAIVAFFDILPESKRSLSWPVFLAAIAGGYGLFWVIGTYVWPICPSCALSAFESGEHHVHGEGLVILSVVLGIHCFVDGLGVSTAVTVAPSLGMRVFGAIALHKVPEGFALMVVLLTGGGSAWQAFRRACAIESATLGGALAAAVWAHPSNFWMALVLAHVGGTFLYLSASGLQDAFAARPSLRQA